VSNDERQGMADAQSRTKRAQLAATVAKAIAHPLRSELLSALAEAGKASPSELAAASSRRVSLSALSYHVQQLRALGLLQPAGTRQRRGAVEHFYRLSPKGELVLGFVDRIGDHASG
jgi:DNA-binding transcriptional ArsR family regulator